jgi:hypothetical protein
MYSDSCYSNLSPCALSRKSHTRLFEFSQFTRLLLSSDYKTLPQDGGYWQEQIPKSEAALCAAIDPAADFRWHSLNCGGPETASFICELPGMYGLVFSSVTSGKT